MIKEVNLICGCGTTKKSVEWVDIPNVCDVCKQQVHVTASLSRIKGETTAPVEKEVKKKKSKEEPAAEVDTAEEKPVE
jgi:hypothetical protein